MPVKIDLTGKRFGKLTVIKQDLSKIGGAAYWICKCDCGKTKSIRGDGLRNGTVINCGCEKKKKIFKNLDMVGKRFGRLTVLERDMSKPSGRGYSSYWVCKCDCGKIKTISQSCLSQGKTKSCGCLRSEKVSKKNTLNLTGKRYGKLIALENTFQLSSHDSYIWKCQCDCGDFYFTSAEILQSGKVCSCGCAKQSYGEIKISQILTDNNIPFNTEYIFTDLKNEETNRYFRYDFAIMNEENKVIRLIEFDGEQHFYSREYFGGEEGFKTRQKHDNIKNQYAKKHNIPLVRIPYTEIKNINLDMIMGEQFLV
jgi:hypothetical protein